MDEKKQKEEVSDKGFKLFQKRTLELAGGDKDKVKISEQMAELELDFEFVKNLNTELANKYEELMGCFPTADEIDFILKENYENPKRSVIECKKGDNIDNLRMLIADRIIKLKKFKSALVALESQDPSAKPIRYDDLVKE